jgi:MFS family permease
MIFGPVYGVAYGSLITIFPTIYGNYYGAGVFANINGFFAPFLTIAGSVVPTAAGFMVEKFGSYNGMFLILTLLLVLGLLLSAFLSPPRKKAAS